MATSSPEAVREEVRAWIADNWDPDLTVGEWWARLTASGYAAPTFPEEDFGRGYSRSLANIVNEELAAAKAVGPPAGLGYLLAAPTIATHATREQKDVWLQRIFDGRDAWCQLFSEPGAGSDLAGLQCKAERDGDEWVITGQKVWTSTAQLCNMGMLIARTDPESPKHTGITYFGIEMDQPGIEIRPLKEMTGRAMFNEVFLDGARVPHANMIGELNNGWAVANTTLAAERAGLGSGGSGAAGSAFPGPLVESVGRARRRHGRPGAHRWDRRWRRRHGAAVDRTREDERHDRRPDGAARHREAVDAPTDREVLELADARRKCERRSSEHRQADDERHAPAQP